MSLMSIDAKIGWRARTIISFALIGILAGTYLIMAYSREAENPDDKIMPTPTKLLDGVKRVAFEKDAKDGVRLWVDTWASGKRFVIAIAILFLAIPIGTAMGVFPFWDALLYRFVLVFDKVPAMALLPILFIVFGLGELSKVALILLGVFPTVLLDTYLRAKSTPFEQLEKAKTLGASGFEIAFRVVMPQIFPKILDTIRLNLKSVLMLLIAGESLAASVGLGYRIFVVRRYVAMDVIIPYVIWMTLLLYIIDHLFSYWVSRYRWLDK